MSSTSLSILERAKSRADEQAWRDLEQIYAPLLRKWMLRYDVADSDADDLVQEILLFVAERLPEFEHNGRAGAFRSWLRQALVYRLRKLWNDRQQRTGDYGVGHRRGVDLLHELEDPKSSQSQLLGAFDFKAQLVHSVAYSPDGHLLACGRSDGSLVVIDRETREQRIFSGHTDAADALVFTPDGRRLISGGRDRTLRVWDIATGQEILRETAENHIFNRLALTSDGRTLLSGGGWYFDNRWKEDIWESDNALRLWPLVEQVAPANGGVHEGSTASVK